MFAPLVAQQFQPPGLIEFQSGIALRHHAQRVAVVQFFRRDAQPGRLGGVELAYQGGVGVVDLGRESLGRVQLALDVFAHDIDRRLHSVVRVLLGQGLLDFPFLLLGDGLHVRLGFQAAETIGINLQVVQQGFRQLRRGDGGRVLCHGDLDRAACLRSHFQLVGHAGRHRRHLVGQAGLHQDVGVDVDIVHRAVLGGLFDERFETGRVDLLQLAGRRQFVQVLDQLRAILGDTRLVLVARQAARGSVHAAEHTTGNHGAQQGLIGSVRAFCRVLCPGLVRVGDGRVHSVLHQRGKLFRDRFPPNEPGQKLAHARAPKVLDDETHGQHFGGGFDAAFNRGPGQGLVGCAPAQSILGVGLQAGLHAHDRQPDARVSRRKGRSHRRDHLQHTGGPAVQALRCAALKLRCRQQAGHLDVRGPAHGVALHILEAEGISEVQAHPFAHGRKHVGDGVAETRHDRTEGGLRPGRGFQYAVLAQGAFHRRQVVHIVQRHPGELRRAQLLGQDGRGRQHRLHLQRLVTALHLIEVAFDHFRRQPR